MMMQSSGTTSSPKEAGTLTKPRRVESETAVAPCEAAAWNMKPSTRAEETATPTAT